MIEYSSFKFENDLFVLLIILLFSLWGQCAEYKFIPKTVSKSKLLLYQFRDTIASLGIIVLCYRIIWSRNERHCIWPMHTTFPSPYNPASTLYLFLSFGSPSVTYSVCSLSLLYLPSLSVSFPLWPFAWGPCDPPFSRLLFHQPARIFRP